MKTNTALFLFGCMGAGCVGAFAQTTTNMPPVPHGSAATIIQQQLILLIPILVPVLLSVLKSEVPKLPGWALPIIAPALGAGIDYLMQLGGASNVANPIIGAVLGSAGVGLRELKDQVQQRVQQPKDGSSLPDSGKDGQDQPPQAQQPAAPQPTKGNEVKTASQIVRGIAGVGMAALLLVNTGCKTTSAGSAVDPAKIKQAQAAIEPAVSAVVRRVILNSPQHSIEIGNYVRAVATVFCQVQASGQFSPQQVVDALNTATAGLQTTAPAEIIDAKNAAVALYTIFFNDSLTVQLGNNVWPNAVCGLFCNSLNQALADAGQPGTK